MDIKTTAPEIPSPIDFSDPVQAKAWVDMTVAKRPWRPRFFEAFTHALNSLPDSFIRVVELGSGPGHLAKAILDFCPHVISYVAIDFSPAMHDLARAHLGPQADKVCFEIRDFRDENWATGLSSIDVIVTMQAAHEVRHKSRLPRLLMQMHAALRPGGVLLFCDHYAEVGSAKSPQLHPEYDEQRALIKTVGFVDIVELLNEGGMALIQCRKGG
jgi:SAM-dependent methyltransferase